MDKPILRAERSGITYTLNAGKQILGRGREADIRIEDPTISRSHAEILWENGQVVVRDLGSMNGTFVNGSQVKSEATVALRDRVRFGHLDMLLVDEEETRPHTPLSPESSSYRTLTTSYQEIQEQAKKSTAERVMATLATAGSMLTQRMKVDELYSSMLDLIQEAVPASRIFILGKDLGPSGPTIISHRLIHGNSGEPLLMSQNLLRQILDDGQSLLTDLGTISATESMVQAGIQAALGAPLFDNEEILGAIYVDSRMPGTQYAPEELRLLTLLANVMAVKISQIRKEEEEAAIRRELEAAERIQKRLLPETIPDVPSYEIFAFQEACLAVGGDLYDVQQMADGRVWLLLGDVSGKGIGAALLMANAMAAVQYLENPDVTPLQLVTRLEEYLEQHIGSGQFITLFVGLLDPVTGDLQYVNAGHDSPILLGGDEVSRLEPNGGAVAMLPREIRLMTPALERTQASCVIKPGCSLLVFSDGISETEYGGSVVKEFTDMQYSEVRFDAFLDECRELKGRELAEKLLDDVIEFRGDNLAADDLTLLVLSRPR